MDVRCDRCGTEYEFDDALISERGTTVQCTECGSKFKVFPVVGAPAPERWIVRGGGASPWETHFVSLRDLQAAIMRGAVGPTDLLQRGSDVPRALSTIAELEPLFAERSQQKKLGGTLAGVAPHAGAPGLVAPPHAGLPIAGSRAPEPPTQAVPAKRRVSTKMGLPTPADAPPGFTSLSAPPPELTPDAPRVEVPQASRVPSPTFAKTLASGFTEPSGAPKRPERGFLEPAAEPARDFTSTMPSFGTPSPDVAPGAAPRSPLPPAGDAASPPRPRIVSALSASELAPSGQAPAAAGAPVDMPPAFARTMIGMSQAPAAPGAAPRRMSPAPTATQPLAMQPTRQEPALPPQVTQEATRTPEAAAAERAPQAPAPTAPMQVAAPTPQAFSPAVQEVPPLEVPQAAPQVLAPPQAAPPQAAPQAGPAHAVPPALPQQHVLPQGAYQQAMPPQVATQHTARQPVAEPALAPVQRVAPEPVADLDEDFPGMKRRRGPWRVLVVLALLGAAGLAGATVGRPAIERLLSQKSEGPAAPLVKAGVEPLVEKARALVQEGDLDGARDQLERAVALSPTDPAQSALVAIELARADVLAAELEDLRLSFVSPEQTERLGEVKEALMDRLDRARPSVAAALKASPSDPRALSAQMSLSRLAGDRARALEQKAALPSTGSTAEEAYALAAFDLSDTPPKLAEAIQRLSPVVATEGRLGIARSALIFALVRSGDPTRASAEFQRLKAQALPSSKLLPDVSTFMMREVGGEAAPEASSAAPVASAAPSAAPAAPGAVDFRVRLQRANDALNKGDLNQADALYRSVLQENAGNTEAIAGKADVARRRGQLTEAARLYDQVLAQNPSYLPALIGRADMLWSSGERSQALKLYRRVVDQVGSEGTYGKHAQERIDAVQAERPSQSSPSSPAPTESQSPKAAPESGDTPPNIDTTDLQ